ncbi:hypothetical protein [Dongia sedimenti]|uniref:Uncharacterized protein n=1 Tax=Dongia sedimenti TaxID=3064282 RepID=A0ABU0YSP1_9PROT|nr:hypothetical protein [Rhodospirillaceae bacterium R-7]
MGLYLVFATRDLRAAVSTICTSFYMPFDRLAVVSYEGSAGELARRLDLDRTGGPGALIGAVNTRRVRAVATGFAIALLSFVLT